MGQGTLASLIPLDGAWLKGDLCSVPYARLPALSAEDSAALCRELEALKTPSPMCRHKRASMSRRQGSATSPSCGGIRRRFARDCTNSPATLPCRRRCYAKFAANLLSRRWLVRKVLDGHHAGIQRRGIEETKVAIGLLKLNTPSVRPFRAIHPDKILRSLLKELRRV